MKQRYKLNIFIQSRGTNETVNLGASGRGIVYELESLFHWCLSAKMDIFSCYIGATALFSVPCKF